MNIKQEIEHAKEWVEISEATLKQVIEEGQPEEIIEYERGELEYYKKYLSELLKKNGEH